MKKHLCTPNRTSIKSLLLSGAILFSVPILYSQSYIPLPDSNAFWRITNGTTTDIFFTDSVLNDTTVNLKTYVKLFYKYTASVYAGCYRNDNINKKAFYIPPDSTQEFLVYDFGVNVGDTATVIHKNQSFPAFPSTFQIRKIVVDSIVYRTIGPRSHKRIYLSTSNDLDMWTEGIGNINGVVSVYPWNSQILWCMSYNDTIYYSNNFSLSQENNYYPGNCDTVTVPLSVNPENSTSLIKIFPTVSSTAITIQSSGNLHSFEVRIYSSLGELISMQSLGHNSILNIAELSNGLYFIQIYSGNKQHLSTKFIKQ